MNTKLKLIFLVNILLVLILAAGCNGSEALKPQAGAIIYGDLVPEQAGTNASANSGGLQITVTGDGEGISQATLAIAELHCTNETGDASISSEGLSTTVDFSTPVVINNGQFSFNLARDANEKILVEGNFTSPTEATAVITISATVTVAPAEADYEGTFSCDYGTMSWSGIAQ